ncbi:MAG: DUF2249 domain-containing protein [Verrucomicrobiota bacterium JB022]|nr:DUF2249 domain-containing protein [Verrucomicrobiota bacterium JB022]
MTSVKPEMDLGAILAQGISPLPVVQERIAALAPGEALVLCVPFEPVPLYEHIRQWGADYAVASDAAGFRITVTKQEASALVPVFLDLRRLPPPEPMQRTLETFASLPPGGCLVVHLPHRPRPLLEQLEARGIAWEEDPQADGSCQIYLQKVVS